MDKTWFIATEHSPANRQLATQFLTRGDRVITTARNPLLLEDLKTRHATTLTVYAADDADIAQLGVAVQRAFAEHGPVHTVIGPDPVMGAALPHLLAQGNGRMIRPPHCSTDSDTDKMVTVTVTSQHVVDSNSWPRAVITETRNQTSLTEDQLRRLQPGMWGQPSRSPAP